MEGLPGVDVPKVAAWLEANVAGAQRPFAFTLIAGGHSNLTFRVTDANGARYVLRRPPLGQVLATAHDMAREHRIISALGPTDVPVPPVLGLCTDDDVNGAPFYVMGFVDGHILRDAATATAALDEAARRRAGESVVDTLAAIHAVDLDAVGLGDLAKRDGYIARQLKRWYGQFQASNAETNRDVPLIHEVHDRLASAVPEQERTAIVHGDYRLDNCLIADDGSVAAVLDWELCTLGDPLADLGLLHVYWAEPADDVNVTVGSATTAPGFLTRAEVSQRYDDVSGLDLSNLGYYVAFGYWKLACILEGVYARYAGGAMGAATGFEGFAEQVTALAERAAQASEGIKTA